MDNQYGYGGGQPTANRCAYCGQEMEAGSAFCASCGRPVQAPVPPAAPYMNQPAGGYPNAAPSIPYGVSKGEFRREYAPAELKKGVRTVGIVGYVLAGINLLVAILNPFALIDVVILLGLTLGIHLGKSKGCAIAMLVYGIFSCVVGIVSTGTPTGWAWIILGAVAMSQIGKIDKVYEQVTASRPGF